MAHMDVFETQAFHMATLTAALLDRPHQPGRIGELDFFQSQGIRTTDVSIEAKGNTLALVPVTDRGAPMPQNRRDARSIRKFPTFRIGLEDTISAQSIQDVRGFGSEDALQSLQAEVNDRNASMSAKVAVTEEWQRMGALKGQILDSDGSTVLLDLFTEFGVSAHTPVNWDLDAVSPAKGVLRQKCTDVQRLIRAEIGDLPVNGYRGLCGSAFFDALVAHPNYIDTHQNYVDQRLLREQAYRRIVNYGGITFEEYEGTVSGQDFVGAGDILVIPEGVPDLMLTRYAPGEDLDQVHTIGLPRYASTLPDPSHPRRRRILEVATYPLHILTRPRAVIPGTLT